MLNLSSLFNIVSRISNIAIRFFFISWIFQPEFLKILNYLYWKDKYPCAKTNYVWHFALELSWVSEFRQPVPIDHAWKTLFFVFWTILNTNHHKNKDNVWVNSLLRPEGDIPIDVPNNFFDSSIKVSNDANPINDIIDYLIFHNFQSINLYINF